VEFVLVILPLMGLLLLTVDVSWSLFARATLQHAVREGVRYAVTGQVSGSSCLGASVQQVVAQNSFGFIRGTQASSFVSVQYYDPNSLKAITDNTGAAGGNVVRVSVTGVTVKSFGPVFRSAVPISLNASALDVMESPPGGVPPCP
jgi:Flp pilus assembly protein TadG